MPPGADTAAERGAHVWLWTIAEWLARLPNEAREEITVIMRESYVAGWKQCAARQRSIERHAAMLPP